MGVKRRARRSLLPLLAVCIVLVAAAGCSSSGSSASSAGSSPSGGASSEVAAAKAAYTPLTDPDGAKWPKPNQPFAPGKHKVAIVICGAAGAGCSTIGKAADSAAQAMGWSPKVFDGAFDPSKQAGYIQQATLEGYDAIIIAGFDPHTVASAVTGAVNKGLPVVCVECATDQAKGVSVVAGDFTASGVAMGNYMIANSDAKAKVALFTDKAFPHIIQYTDAIKQTLSSGCTACSVDTQYFPTADLAKPGPPTWTAYLSGHPAGSFDWAATGYENMGVPFAKTLQDQGRTDVKVTTYNGTLPDTMSDIESGSSPLVATVIFPTTYEGWSAMDLAARLVTKQQPWDTEHLPVLLVDKTNVGELPEPKGDYQPNFDYKKMFQDQWSG
jgi:ribose transport system substrate-binding protein